MFAQTEMQEMLADLLSRLVSGENSFEARHGAGSTACGMQLKTWPSFVDNGILGVGVAEQDGGFGGGLRDIATVMSVVGSALILIPLLPTMMAGRILSQTSVDQDHLNDIVRGSRILALALDASWDPAHSVQVSSAGGDGGYRLSAARMIVRHGDIATDLIVAALMETGLSLFAVNAREVGVERHALRFIDGSSAAEIRLHNVAATLLAVGPDVDRFVAEIFVAHAAEAYGACYAVNRATFSYLTTRRQFGVPLSNFQALQHRAADVYIAAEELRVLVGDALRLSESGTEAEFGKAARIAKIASDRIGRRIGHEAVQLHGGMGVSDELSISHFMRRFAAMRYEFGRTPGLLEQVATSLLADMRPEPPDANELRDLVGTFVRENLPEDIRVKGERNLIFEKEDYVRWQKTLFENGWFAGAWPKKFGGLGWDLHRQLIFAQEAAVNNAPPIMPWGVNMVGPVLYTFGTKIQQDEHLPGILKSDVWWCQGYSEPNSGSDLASLRTTAERDGDHYIVNGTKMWTTEAHWADMMHCLVRTDRSVKPQAGISLLLIDMNTPGITISPIITIDGQHHTNQVFLDNVRVPCSNLVGQEGQGWTIAKFLLANERVAIADTGPKLKLLKGIKEMFQAQIMAGGIRSAEAAVLRTRVTDAEIDLHALCAMELDYVTQWRDGKSKAGPEASVLKIRGTEILQMLTELAVDVQGVFAPIHDPNDLHPSGGEQSLSQRASAMSNEYLYGRIWSIFGGSNEIQRNIVAKSILHE